MGRIWSDQNEFQQWLEVELAASEALASLGVVPAEAARLLREHAGFDVARIHEIEKEVKHDVIAFTTAVAETMKARGHAEASRWFHYGLTSNDVWTPRRRSACSRQGPFCSPASKDSARCFSGARWNSSTRCRSGVRTAYTRPITFGLKLAIWHEEAKRNLTRLSAAIEDVRSENVGAVGTFGHIDPKPRN